MEDKPPDEKQDLEGFEVNEEKPENSNLDDITSHVEDLRIGKIRSDSDSSDDIPPGDDDSMESSHPPLTRASTRNSVPASVMSHPHPQSGADLEKGPTGPKNNTVDEEGRIVVNWASRSDPENPKNWSRKKKIFNVVVISSMTFLCPLCSAMFVRIFCLTF
jgi:hypothetical protein